VLLLLPDLVPDQMSFHITVVSLRSEVAVILFFAVITVCSAMLESIQYINNVKTYSYRRCLSFPVRTAWGLCTFVATARYP
jgi:hypothetical protein